MLTFDKLLFVFPNRVLRFDKRPFAIPNNVLTFTQLAFVVSNKVLTFAKLVFIVVNEFDKLPIFEFAVIVCVMLFVTVFQALLTVSETDAIRSLFV